MRPRLLARCPHSNDPDAAAQVWRRHGGDDPPLEADGILLPERGEQIAIRCLGVLSSHMLQDEMCP